MNRLKNNFIKLTKKHWRYKYIKKEKKVDGSYWE